jgi:hypothetical protein
MQMFGGQSATFVTLAIVAVLMMVRIGLTKRALAARHVRRPCPSCGRTFTGRVCPWCTRR